MSSFILTRILRWMGEKLDGKKTIIGAIGKMIIGVLALLGVAFPDLGFPNMGVDPALELIFGAYSTLSGIQGIGVGHKIEKAKNGK